MNKVSLMVMDIGCHVSLDHFGVSAQSLNKLGDLNIKYIKLDGSFASEISDNESNQIYIRTLAVLAGSRDITLLAHGIEHDYEWIHLVDIGGARWTGLLSGKTRKTVNGFILTLYLINIDNHESCLTLTYRR